VSEVTLEEAGGVDRCSSPSNHDASGQVKSRVTNDLERSLRQSDDLDVVCWQSLSPLRKRRFLLPTQVAGVCRVVLLRCSHSKEAAHLTSTGWSMGRILLYYLGVVRGASKRESLLRYFMYDQ
jgi:hypothetical protein